MGWDVGTTGTNLGQLTICSWTFRQEEMCALILASVTCEMREAELGRLRRQRQTWPAKALGPSLLLFEHAEPEQQPRAGASGRDPDEEERTHGGIWISQSHTDTAVVMASG